MEDEIRFHIILENPPAGVDFGLQKGKGRIYQVIQKQRSGAADLRFEFSAGIKAGKNSIADFIGSFVQGPPGERFVYIVIGTYAGQTNTVWSRRLKIPLTGISREIINKLQTGPDRFLETKVPGTGRDGGPNCATVKPFPGWKAVKTSNR